MLNKILKNGPQAISVLKNNGLLKRAGRNILGNQQRLTSSIVQSPLGPCGPIPNESLVEHIFKHSAEWKDVPAAVSNLVIFVEIN